MSKKSKTAGLEQFKMEAAREVGVTLGQGYNGELTAKQAGSVGGQMVKTVSYTHLTLPTILLV